MTLIKKYPTLLLLAMSITISYFLGEGDKNMLLIAIMAISPIYILLIGVHKLYRLDYQFLFLAGLMFLSSYIHTDSFRLESYLYSFCFITSFIVLRISIYQGCFRLSFIILFLKYVIYAYGIVLLIQQICILLNLPVFNQPHIWEDNPWKLASLSPEPSHLARFMFFTFYTYLTLQKIESGRSTTKLKFSKDRYVWLSYIWVMLTSQSTTAILFFPLIFIQLLNRKTFLKIIFLGMLLVLIVFLLFQNSAAFQRAINILPTFLTFDSSEITLTDHSAAHRLIPLIGYLENMNFQDFDFWIGKGMDSGRAFFSLYMFNVSGDITYRDNVVSIGGMLNYLIDYGFLIFSYFLYLVWQVIRKNNDRIIVLMWCVINLYSTFNTQMLWFSLILLMISTYFEKRQKYINEMHI